MDGSSPIDAHSDLIAEFRRRFAIFDGMKGKFGNAVLPERIPWFFGFILAAAVKPSPGACCFVLEKTQGTTAVAALLAALVRLQHDFPSQVKHYAEVALQRGQRVKVRPSNFVYEYEGLWEDLPGFFKLKLIGENSWRSFPLTDILRLEPTDRIKPKGVGSSDLGTFEPSPLDHLLDLTTCGNNSIVCNTVLVNMTQARFARVLDSIALTPKHTKQHSQLSHFLPWGSIGHDGILKPNDPYQVTGEPLIATTNVLEDLALATSLSEIASKVVFIDGARRLARDLQAFDDITDRQRTVVLASPDENEELNLLNNRGCPIWHMSADEVLIGEAYTNGRARQSLVGATIRAAKIRKRFNLKKIDCRDDLLEAVAASLAHAAEIIKGKEETTEADAILARLFRILLECSECCFGVGEDTVSDLRSVQGYMVQHAKWLGKEIADIFEDAINKLDQAIPRDFGRQKAEALLNTITEQDIRWAILTRSSRVAERLREEEDILGHDLPILPVSTVSPNHEYRGIILLAWPNARRFTRLKNLSVTAEIRILTYPFESAWLLHHQKQEHAWRWSNRIGEDTCSSILGIDRHLLSGLDVTKSEEKPRYPRETSLDLPALELEKRVMQRQNVQPPTATDDEDSREARLVQFFGGCHALLTEWAELPVLNDLIDSGKGERVKLTSATASRLSTNDFVLFRDSGDKEFLRLIAEEILGEEEYRSTRDLAERWKSALRRFQASLAPAELQQKLANHGIKRTLSTIVGWLDNPDRIGPRNHDDIEIIAKITADTELLSSKDEVKSAISRIRGAHLAAGMQLTKLILGELHGKLNELDDQPTLLDLDYGHAWVVQIESVHIEKQNYPVGQVNRLLWSAD